MGTKIPYWKARKLEELTEIKTDEQLSKLNTKHLLSYYKAERLRRIRYRESWYTGWEYSYYIYNEDKWVLGVLSDWEDYLIHIKSHLNKREHVVR